MVQDHSLLLALAEHPPRELGTCCELARVPDGPLPRTSISVCMIALNEAELIGRALANVRSHVDEIVVVDGGSHDQTVEIARQFGAQVIHASWQDHFGQQR